jgi:streptogramin lyase
VVGREGVWVTGRAGLVLIDPRTGHTAGAPIDIGGRAFSLALTRDRIWATTREGRLVEVRRDVRRPVGKPVRYGHTAAEVTTAAGAIWVNGANEADADDPINGVLFRIDPCTHNIQRTRVGRIANTVRAGHGALWITDSADNQVIRFDPVHRRVVRRIPTGFLEDPQDVLVLAESVWITDYFKRRLARIDPRSNKLARRQYEIGTEPGGIAAGAGAIWTASFANGDISRVELRSRRAQTSAVRAGDLLSDIALGYGRLWVPLNGGTAVQTIVP